MSAPAQLWLALEQFLFCNREDELRAMVTPAPWGVAHPLELGSRICLLTGSGFLLDLALKRKCAIPILPKVVPTHPRLHWILSFGFARL